MTKPFFSIITITYNSEDYLADTIASVESQTYTDYEHIFIDGGSTDQTLSLIKQYQQQYSAMVKLFHAPAKGISHAMNVGIEKSTGHYLLHLHSDDYLHDENVLQDVATYLRKHPDLDWIYGQIKVVEVDGRRVGIFPRHKLFQLGWRYLLQFFNFIPHQAVFIKKSVFTQYGGFDESLKTAMDQDLWFRLNYQTKWGYYHRLISVFRVHQGSQSSSRKEYDRNRDRYKSVQHKYLTSAFDHVLAKVFHAVEERINQTTR